MALATFTRPAPFGAIATHAVVNRFEAVLNAITAWDNARKTQKALMALSDRQLEDIGMTRADIVAMSFR